MEVLERKKKTAEKPKSRAQGGERKFECGECGKDFASKGILETHVAAVHRQEKPYQCEECDKEFPYVSSYKSKGTCFREILLYLKANLKK